MSSYIYRDTRPAPMATPGPLRIVPAVGQRLSVIVEGSQSNSGQTSTQEKRRSNRLSLPAEGPRTLPAALTNLPFSRRAHLGDPPSFGDEKTPPDYASYQTSSAQLSDQHRGLRSGLSGRGGRGRLVLIIALAIIAILAIALGVGLGIGLSRKSSSGASQGGTDGSDNSTSQPFPIGSWSFSTYLNNISTDCVSNADTFRCFPYSTYTTSPLSSQAPFNWIITKDSQGSLQISSSSNPFSLVFANVTLTLNDQGSELERYSFQVPNTIKQVIPLTPLTSTGAVDVCFFNATTLSADLYTRRKGTESSAGSGGMITGETGFKTWAHAVEITQSASGGEDVPNCFPSANGGVSGGRIPVPTKSSSSQCQCLYANFES